MSAFHNEAPLIETGHLTRNDGHQLAWETRGNPLGIPLLFLHGGPGSGIGKKNRCMFDPERFRIILLNQRGAGASRPIGSLAANTTEQLVQDIEALRTELDLDQWLVMGPSWGSTLALAYAQTHPGRVRGLLVEAVFLGTREEMDWWHHPLGAPRFFPEAWNSFIEPVPADQRNSAAAVQAWYYDAMCAEAAAGAPALDALSAPSSALDTLRQSLLYRWTEYEDTLSYLEISPEEIAAGLRERGRDFVLSHSLIEAHYFVNDCFLAADQLIANAEHLAQIPMSILHSRYDMVCPARSAIRLAKACPHAEFRLVTLAGHALTEETQSVLNGMMARLAARACPEAERATTLGRR